MAMTWQAYQERLIHYNAAMFRQLLDVLARPGAILPLPPSEPLGAISFADEGLAGTALNQYLVSAVATLADRETTFAVALGGRWLEESSEFVMWLARFTGARHVTPAAATFALCLDGASGTLLEDLAQGTDAEPEGGATAFIAVTALGVEPQADATTLELRGAGIRDAATLAVAGLPLVALEAIHATRQAYPLGVDVYLIDTLGHCVGLPRTTHLTQVGG